MLKSIFFALNILLILILMEDNNRFSQKRKSSAHSLFEFEIPSLTPNTHTHKSNNQFPHLRKLHDHILKSVRIAEILFASPRILS